MEKYEDLIRNCEDANLLWNEGCNYYNGNNGVPRDYEKAFSLYEKAAGLGSSDAENMLGFMYQNGQGVDKDEKAAFDWYVKCAEHGNAWGMSNAGWCLLNGVGTDRDYPNAIQYLEKAMSQQSYPNFAPSLLGEIYEKGLGVESDLSKAFSYYLIAADQGNDYSQNQIDRVEGLLGETAFIIYQNHRDRTGSWIAGRKLTEREQAVVAEKVCKSLNADYSFPFFISKDGRIIKELIHNVASTFGPDEELVIPYNVEDIDCIIPRRFYERIVFPAGIRHISANWKSEDDMDHGGNWTIKEVVIPPTVESVDETAFEYFDALQSIIVPEEDVDRMKAIFPDRLKKYIKGTLNKAADGAQLSGNGTLFVKAPKNITNEYIVPEGVKVICNHAFDNCFSFEGIHIVLPKSLEEIEERAFESFLSGKSITILSDKLKKIGDYAFYGTQFKKIQLPDSVVHIGNCAFKECRELESINIPKSLKHLGFYAFESCFKLSSELVLPAGIEFAKPEFSFASVFSDCWSLTSVKFSEGITEIPDGMFRNCLSLADIVLPESLVFIGQSAFEGCLLTELTLPASLRQIGDSDNYPSSFDGQSICFQSHSPHFQVENGNLFNEDGLLLYDFYANTIKSKTHVLGDEMLSKSNRKEMYVSDDGKRLISCGADGTAVIPLGVETILDNAFSTYAKFKELVIPEGVKHLGTCSLMLQFELKSVTLPSSLETIGSDAFVSTAIESLVIPEHVRYLGHNPFGDSLTEVVFKGIPERIDWKTDQWGFSIPKNLKRIVIPQGGMEQFKRLLDERLQRFLVEAD